MKKTLLITTAVLALSASTIAEAGSSFFILHNLMSRRDVNAIHLDGKTWLEVAHPWNVPPTGYDFMRSWWERSDKQTEASVIFSIATKSGNEAGDLMLVYEIPSQDYNMDTLFILFTVLDTNGEYSGVECYVPNGRGVIKRNGIWTLVQIKINSATQECQYVVQQGNTVEAGHMFYTSEGTSRGRGPIPWGDATSWKVGSATNTSGNHPILDYAESYMNLTFDWDLIGGNSSARLIFATEDGFARNLDWQQGSPPLLHDCGEPLAGLFPEMCNRGNPNYFPNGHEVAPGQNAYTMTVNGTLQIPESDPCLFPGIGDGCSGP